MRVQNILSVIVLTIMVLHVKAQNPVVAPVQKKPIILAGGTIYTGTGEVK